MTMTAMGRPCPATPRDWEGLQGVLGVLGLELRRNMRSFNYEVHPLGEELAPGLLSRESWKPDAAGWGVLGEGMSAFLRQYISKNFLDERGKRLSLNKDCWGDCIAAIGYCHEVDPFKVWLGGRPGWDKVLRNETMLIDCLGAEDTLVNRMVGRMLLPAAILRTYQPGLLLDWWPVLIGAGGLGKSTLVRCLLPDDRPEWFSNSPTLKAGQQKMVEAIGSSVIVEFPEIQSSYGAEAKRIISTSEDQFRDPYAHATTPKPRRWIAVATANRGGSGVLPDDPDGNRRFVAVHCRPIADTSEECTRRIRDYLNENRDQMWAEALVAAENLTSLAWPGGLEAERDSVNEEYAGVNEVLVSLVAALTKDHKGKAEGHALGGLMVEAEISKDAPDASRDARGQEKVAALLRNFGWERGMDSEGEGGMLWFPPGG